MEQVKEEEVNDKHKEGKGEREKEKQMRKWNEDMKKSYTSLQTHTFMHISTLFHFSMYIGYGIKTIESTRNTK